MKMVYKAKWNSQIKVWKWNNKTKSIILYNVQCKLQGRNWLWWCIYSLGIFLSFPPNIKT
jgi:hypothetical protein